MIMNFVSSDFVDFCISEIDSHKIYMVVMLNKFARQFGIWNNLQNFHDYYKN